ncbi:peptidase S8/S53 domain-containing protein [Xylaria scruposa]|nr:peptidase S8/S53 domain-containing protein [Xylaria scruposa]
MSKNVDVISMSFTIISLEEDRKLKLALQDAGEKGIVILCSTHDEGSKVAKAWPADHEGEYVLVVGACDELGRALSQVDTDKCTRLLLGQNVAAGVIPFLEPNDRITGSSVATALAAGLSSLTLSCDRMADAKRDAVRNQDNRAFVDSVRRCFKEMVSREGSKFVDLDKFGKMDQRVLGQAVNAKDIIFGDWTTKFTSGAKIGEK